MIVTPLCEYTVNPLGVGAAPRLMWKMESQQPSPPQTAYRVVAATSLEKLTAGRYDLYDSGEVSSADNFCDYKGAPLESCMQVFWAVEVTAGGQKAVSPAASFETAILDGALWQGRWIGTPHGIPAVAMFRRRFKLTKPVKRARAYLAAEGYTQFYINGQKQGDAVLDPANTDYQKRLAYISYDITPDLQQGDNCFGVMLSEGWAQNGAPKFCMQAFVWYEDGSRDSFYTAPMEWVFILSPIVSATIYSGEVYNRLYERPEWYSPGSDFETRYRLGKWRLHSAYLPETRDENPGHYDEYANVYYHAAELVAPGGVLEPAYVQPIKVMDSIKPVRILEAPGGIKVVDFGQNFAGFVRIRLHGEAGGSVTMRFSELIKDDHSLNMDYLTVADPTYKYPMQTDRVIFSDTSVFEYTQTFTYHGFRYMALEGAADDFCLDDVTGLVVYSSVEQAGEFSCSDSLINKIQQNIVWTEKGNLYSIPTDCPQRAERMGWLNDLSARAEESVYNFNLSRFYTKFLRDIHDTQDAFSGAIADVAPRRRAHLPGDPVSCFTQLPELIYQFYGDDRPIAEHYDSMKKWTGFLYRNAKDGVLPLSFWGDWASPVDCCCENGLWSAVSAITPGDFVSSCFLYYNVCRMFGFAKHLHKDDEARYYARIRLELNRQIHAAYYDAETANYAGGSQGSNVLAVYFGLCAQENIPRVMQNVNADVISRGYHLTTGNLCTKYLLEMLTEYGYVDTAYKLAVQTTYPSWGYMVENGATSIWERWELATGAGMNSHSHPMYGSVSAWYFKYLAGISPAAPGFSEIRIKPYFPDGLSWVKAAYTTPYGRVACSWGWIENQIQICLTIPDGAKARVWLPPCSSVTLNDVKNGLCAAKEKDGRLVIPVSSGEHEILVGL